jgi:diguanylate cyclase (GGDEF)-like protein
MMLEGNREQPKVLVVDDRAENRTALEALLEDLPVEVLCADSGEVALEQMLEHSFAVVLMDVQMPGMDGFETVAMMRQHRRTAHTPVVFVTAISTERRFVQQGYEVGAVDYLFKPLDPEILRSKVGVFVELYEMSRLLEQKNAELEAMAERLREASLRDPLTGLHNRRFLIETVDPDLAISRRLHRDRRAKSLREGVNTDVGFLMIDVDHFKKVNDDHGHLAGDQVLVEFARRVEATLRETDTLVRWGGEEFLAVLRRTEPDGLAIVAERIRAAVEETVFTVHESTGLQLTCSLGFSRYPVCGGDSFRWDEVVQVADRALYLAKARGRNTWVGVEIDEHIDEDGAKRELIGSLGGTEVSEKIRLLCREDLPALADDVGANGGSDG